MAAFPGVGPTLSPGTGTGFGVVPYSAAGGYGSGATNKPILSPWMDYSTATVPDSHDLVLWWAQYLWLMDGNYRSAMERVAAHFMTIIEFPDLEPDEENAWRDFFNNNFNYRRDLLACAHDYLAFGNLFVTLHLPFRRYVICQKCSLDQPITEVEYNLSFTDRAPYLIWNRIRRCPKCGSDLPYLVHDRRDTDLSKVKLNRYSPMEMDIAQNRFSLRKDIYWNIPEDDRRDINNRARIHIDDTPLEILQAVAVSGKVKFNPDLILHVEEPCISGVRTRGWGIPRTIATWRTGWMQQMSNKMDQAIISDYTLGMRMISPAPAAGGSDPMQVKGLQDFVANLEGIISQHRLNPASYHAVPYAMNYQFLGGEGKDLMPPDKLKFRQQEYLNQIGVPLEYHQMSLSTQAAPNALRLFEAYWQQVPAFYNEVLNWVIQIMTKTYNLDSTKVQMQKTTVVDDSNYKALLLQLMGGNQLSAQTALEPLGIDAHTEVRKVMRHQDYVARVQQEFDEKAEKRQELAAFKKNVQQPDAAQVMQQQQAGAQGQPPPAGAPQGGMPQGGMPGAGPTPQSLEEIADQATQIAQTLVTLPEYERKQQLKQLRQGNKQLHALVTQQLEELRNQARSQGQNLILSPQASGQG